MDSAEHDAARDIEERRYDEALRKYRALAESGSGTAQLRLGWMYETGKGVGQDLKAAENWYLSAASTGAPHAQYYLANLYRRNEQYDRAVEWLEKAGAQGYSPAIYALGQLSYFGAGVPANRQKAFDYFEEAARRGHLFAARNVAREMIAGRRGLRRIPLGIVLMIKVFWKGIRLARHEPDSDLLKH